MMMMSAPLTSHIAVIITTVSLFGGSAVTAYDDTLVSIVCNGHTFRDADPWYDMPSVITDYMVSHTPENVGTVATGYVVYIKEVGIPQVPLYGGGYCSGAIWPEDCSGCMNSAKSQLFKECGYHRYGAQVHLKDCDLRYEFYKISDVK
ncbi:hypothetical protein MLD38_028961 [Melastoma candidum]|uniref:Uncharacterized protein n=1 Tax=Melastoma candidum TaxID=119954 RepID=A0ACB9N464_9MYRT|nr:hypothetical protein MLD38_028961 [Melastoma candidum]